jgi:drug/metabolite transporter (DMT)-like permease
MTINEIAPLIRYLNSGMIILVVDLILRRLDFELTLQEYRKRPLQSLFLGLSLILISSLVSLFFQALLSAMGLPGMETPNLSIVLFFVYLFVIFIRFEKKRKRKR